MMTLKNEMIIEQPCTTKKINIDYLTEVETIRKESKRWVESIPSSPYLPMVPFSRILESPIPFNRKGE